METIKNRVIKVARAQLHALYHPTKLASIFCLALASLLTGCIPPGPRSLLHGQKLIDQGKYAEAVEKLEIATSILTTNANAWNYLGIALHYAGRPAEAQKVYQRALTLDHDLSEAHYNLGCLWLEQNRPDNAKTEFTAYTLRRGNSLDALLRLGSAQLRSGDLTGAEKSFDDALHLLPENPDALNALGLVKIQRRRPAEAAPFFSRALKQRPGYSPALLNLAILHHQYLKDSQAAMRGYREYLALKPAPPKTEAVAFVLRQLEQEVSPPAPPPPSPSVVNSAPIPPAAPPKPPVTNQPHLATVSKPSPTNAAKPQAALTQPTRPKADSAAPFPPPLSTAPLTGKIETVKIQKEPVFKPAQDISPTVAPPQPASSEPAAQPTSAEDKSAEKSGLTQPNNPAGIARSGNKTIQVTALPGSGSSSPPTEPPAAPAPSEIPSNQNETTASRYHYQSPPAPPPGDHASAERALAQGVQAEEDDKKAQAEQAFRTAVQLDPSCFEAQYNLGRAATAAGHLSIALTAYEYALAIKPDSTDARYNFAIVLKQTDHFTDSASELQKMLARNPSEVRAHLALANLYARELNQPAKARAHYQNVLDANPNHPQAGAIRYWLASNPP